MVASKASFCFLYSLVSIALVVVSLLNSPVFAEARSGFMKQQQQQHLPKSSDTGIVSVSHSETNSLRRLKERLNIGDDPNEDIRTNRLLNMEGI